jgi:hypothetical protein
MYLTHDDAHDYECPFAALQAIVFLAYREKLDWIDNQFEDNLSLLKCKGENCMMWRKVNEKVIRGKIDNIDPCAEEEPKTRPVDVPQNWLFIPFHKNSGIYQFAMWVEDDESYEKRKDVPCEYCGLAGKPKQ